MPRPPVAWHPPNPLQCRCFPTCGSGSWPLFAAPCACGRRRPVCGMSGYSRCQELQRYMGLCCGRCVSWSLEAVAHGGPDACHHAILHRSRAPSCHWALERLALTAVAGKALWVTFTSPSKVSLSATFPSLSSSPQRQIVSNVDERTSLTLTPMMMFAAPSRKQWRLHNLPRLPMLAAARDQHHLRHLRLHRLAAWMFLVGRVLYPSFFSHPLT